MDTEFHAKNPESISSKLDGVVLTVKGTNRQSDKPLPIGYFPRGKCAEKTSRQHGRMWSCVYATAENDMPSCTSSMNGDNITLTCVSNFSVTLDSSQQSTMIPVGNWSDCSPNPVVFTSIKQLSAPYYRKYTSTALIQSSDPKNVRCRYNIHVTVSPSISVDPAQADNHNPLYVGQTWTYSPDLFSMYVYFCSIYRPLKYTDHWKNRSAEKLRSLTVERSHLGFGAKNIDKRNLPWVFLFEKINYL
jgi:hypothetical protein